MWREGKPVYQWEKKPEDKTMSADTGFILRLYQICAILIF